MNRLWTVAGVLFCLVCAACDAGTGGDAGDAAGSADAPGGGGGPGARDGRGGGAGGDSAAVPTVPTLSSASVRVTGAAGQDLTIDVIGADEGGDAAFLHIRVTDAGGRPVPAWALTPDGLQGTAEHRAAFDAPLAGKTSFSGRVSLARMAASHPEIASVTVAVEDARGDLSEEVTAPVSEQPQVELGAACDPAHIETRCAPGYGCRGVPPACAEGRAPELVRVAYVRTDAGARILMTGTEPEDDLAVVRLDFLDARGNPVAVDLDNDESPESESFDVEAEGLAYGGTFFLALDSTESFAAQVPRIAATARDMAGHVGATKTVNLAPPTTRGAAATCDPRGFDVCAAGLACTPGDPAVRNTCQRLTSLQPRVCREAPVLDPAAGVDTVAGRTGGASLWDAPPVCSAGDPVRRPEGLALLRLRSAAASVTLSTAESGTNFDTVLYVLPGCAPDSAGALGCVDDTEDGAAAVLTLEMVPAGDYLVVVDSWGPEGGDFVLTVTVE
jgi:hypothetical protein